MTVGLVVLLVALAAATVLGFWHRRGNGRFRRPEPARLDAPPSAGDPGADADPDADPGVAPSVQAPATEAVPVAEFGVELGERATLLQFSSAFCAPCRATRQVLSDVEKRVPGIRHVDVDAESHLELVRRLGIRRTPTVLVLDPAGREVTRAAGLPRRDDVLTVLRHLLEVPTQA